MLVFYLVFLVGALLNADAQTSSRARCGRNAVYNGCGTACPKTCQNRFLDFNCIAACRPGCFCVRGYVLDSTGACVREEDCPPLNTCSGENEVFTECGTACPDTCDNYQNPNRTCTLQCVQGCFCKTDYVRDSDRRCVTTDQC